MAFITNPRQVREIRQGDPDFIIKDGLVAYPRAMLHVSPDCPHSIAESISRASRMGWLKSVAHVKDSELVWDKLSETT